MSDKVATRFAREVTEHQMTVLHDDGLYRHVRFRRPKNEIYWFDLVTVPGVLIFQGDGGSYVFRRTTDMFEFVRGSAWKGQPNPQYWAEKLTNDRDAVMRYDQDLLVRHVKDALSEHYGPEPIPADLEDAIRIHLFEEFLDDETYDRRLVDEFRWYADDEDFPRKPDFEFGDTFEWVCRDYHWWYLWACHAIVWGIAKYDAAKASDVTPPAEVHDAGSSVDPERLERLAQYRRDHEGIYCRYGHHTRLVDLVGNPNDEGWECAHCAAVRRGSRDTRADDHPRTAIGRP